MSDKILLGAVASKLVQNGYIGVSALRPGVHGWTVADDPAAVALIPAHAGKHGVADGNKLTLVTLNIITSDSKGRAAIVAVLARHGIKGGPIRTDAAGNLAYVVRWEDDYFPPESDEIDGVFAVGGYTRRPHGDNQTAIIRCDGSWSGGDLLTIKRSDLPGIADKDALRAIIADVREVGYGRTDTAPVESFEPKWKSYEPMQPKANPELRGSERAAFTRDARGHREANRQAMLVSKSE